MKKALLLVALVWLAAPALALAEVLTVFSDQGVPGTPQGFNPLDTFPNPPPPGLIYTTAPLAGVPEGISAFQTTFPIGTYAGWAITFPSPQNLSRFNNGEFRFWVYSSTGNIEIQLQNENGPQGLLMDTTLSLLNWDWNTMHDRWVLMRIAMSAVNLSSVQHPGVFVATRAPATFFIDNVHFITATTAPNFSVTIKNRSDNSTTNQVTWTTPPATWAMADQYLSVETDSDVLSWGVQLYTNNTLSNANPPFTGAISTFTATPAGLVNTTDTTTTIPLAWATRSDVSTITVVAADPNNATDNNSFQWLIAEDEAQVAVQSLGAAAFVNADPFITTRNNVGIHFSQKPTDFGPADPPYRIYLEAGFGASLAQQTYQTSTLTLELFYL